MVQLLAFWTQSKAYNLFTILIKAYSQQHWVEAGWLHDVMWIHIQRYCLTYINNKISSWMVGIEGCRNLIRSSWSGHHRPPEKVQVHLRYWQLLCHSASTPSTPLRQRGLSITKKNTGCHWGVLLHLEESLLAAGELWAVEMCPVKTLNKIFEKQFQRLGGCLEAPQRNTFPVQLEHQIAQ